MHPETSASFITSSQSSKGSWKLKIKFKLRGWRLKWDFELSTKFISLILCQDKSKQFEKHCCFHVQSQSVPSLASFFFSTFFSFTFFPVSVYKYNTCMIYHCISVNQKPASSALGKMWWKVKSLSTLYNNSTQQMSHMYQVV